MPSFCSSWWRFARNTCCAWKPYHINVYINAIYVFWKQVHIISENHEQNPYRKLIVQTWNNNDKNKLGWFMSKTINEKQMLQNSKLRQPLNYRFMCLDYEAPPWKFNKKRLTFWVDPLWRCKVKVDLYCIMNIIFISSIVFVNLPFT